MLGASPAPRVTSSWVPTGQAQLRLPPAQMSPAPGQVPCPQAQEGSMWPPHPSTLTLAHACPGEGLLGTAEAQLTAHHAG